MACTLANALSDSCTCLGTTEVCGADSYCYEGQCTAENVCGDGLCTTECMCGGDGKIASKCLGDNKYCKNGRVMTLCTADSLAADECACTIEDDGMCMGRCADGNCYGGEACYFEDSSESSCVCALEGKKVGVFKKTYSTVCRSDGTLEAISGGCSDSMAPDAECICKKDGDDCARDSVCYGGSCTASKCGEGKCNCYCAGDSKNAEACYDSNTNQCKDGKVVPLDNKLVCTEQHTLYSYCQCSTNTATLCTRYGLCADSDCYNWSTSACTENILATKTCICKTTNKITTIAKAGDICNSDGTVTKMCTNGVPSQRDVCFCGSKNGSECKKGDVCIGGKCYGEADNATAKYCMDSSVCTTACACTDFSFSEAELCFGPFQKCENNTVVTLKCSEDAKKADVCKCSASAATACPSGSVCSDNTCYGPEEDKDICSEGQFCSTICACAGSGKSAVLCSGEYSQCVDGRVVLKCPEGFEKDGDTCKKAEGGLGAGAIVGIVIAVVVVLAAIIVGVFFLKCRKQEEETDQKEKEEDQVQVAAE